MSEQMLNIDSLKSILENPEQRAELVKMLGVNKNSGKGRGRVSNKDKALKEMKKIAKAYPKMSCATLKKIAHNAWDAVHPDRKIKREPKPGSWQAFVQEQMNVLKSEEPDTKKRFSMCSKLWKDKKDTYAAAAATPVPRTNDPRPGNTYNRDEDEDDESSDWNPVSNADAEDEDSEKSTDSDSDDDSDDDEEPIADADAVAVVEEAAVPIPIPMEYDTPCEVCGDPDDSKDQILLCDGKECNKGYHLKCIQLKKVPTGDWLCPSCRSN